MNFSHKIKVSSSSKEILAYPGETVLDAALREGIKYPFSCNAGRCGTCKSRLLYGEVEHLSHNRFTLSEKEKSEGLTLACRAIPKTDVHVAPLHEVKSEIPQTCESLRVISKTSLTHDTTHLILGSPDESVRLRFLPGQFAMLTIPGFPQRSYSMSNQPGSGELHFYIRQILGGRFSDHALAKLKVDDMIEVRGPYGDSYLETSHIGPILLVAGGLGIAPVQSILQHALSIGMRQLIYLYFGVREARDVYLAEHFQQLAKIYSNFRFHIAVDHGSDEPDHFLGRVGDLVLNHWPEFDGEWRAYLAGPPPMVEGLVPHLLERGFDRDWIKSDPFYFSSEPSNRVKVSV